ncbi:MAG: ribosome hibernation-promoting factor, HPF/YfiA family [Arenicellales bacterium]
MDLIISGQHVDISDSLRSYIEQRIDRVISHAEPIVSAHVVLHIEKSSHDAEITVSVSGAQIHARAHGMDMYGAIDAMADKLDVQLRKHKDRSADHHQKDGGIKRLPETS